MIDKYIAKHYEWPPCWQLVADVYVNELGLSLDDYTPKSNTMREHIVTGKQIGRAHV